MASRARALIATVVLAASSAAGAQCVCDCDRSGALGINDVVRLVTVSLSGNAAWCPGHLPALDCPSCIGIDSLIECVRLLSASDACATPPLPTATPTATPTPHPSSPTPEPSRSATTARTATRTETPQTAATCAITLIPSRTSTGGCTRPSPLSVQVEIADGCCWRASVSSDAVSLASTFGCGSGRIEYTVRPNDLSLPRSHVIFVRADPPENTAAATITIDQTRNCTRTMSPTVTRTPTGSHTITPTATTTPGTHTPARGKIYWTDRSTNSLQRASFDGTQVEDITRTVEPCCPQAIALDAPGAQMYWTSHPVRNKIQRANLDGTRVEDVLTDLDSPEALALDLNERTMYWIENGRTPRIRRASMDGGDIETLYESVSDVAYRQLSDIALDPGRERMYWASPESSSADGISFIRSANLDGSDVRNVVTYAYRDSHPTGIALDLEHAKIYIANPAGVFGGPRIQRANLDGSDLEDLFVGWRAEQIAVDATAGRLYWTDTYGTAGGVVLSSDLDGDDVHTIVGRLARPYDFAIDPPMAKLARW